MMSGCGTPQVTVASGEKLEKYRRVYLVPSNGDPRKVTPRILTRLKKTGFDVTEVTSNTPAIGGQGSGFVLTPEGHILTCAHVVEKNTNATVWIDGTRYLCRVLVADTNADLALLLTEGSHPPLRPMPFAAGTNYAMGEDAYTMGFPLAAVLGTEPRLNKGMISATVGLDDDPKYIQVSAPVQPGNSGGPLLNPRGEAIGVVSATLNPLKVLVQSGGDLPQNVNFALKSSVVRDFLSTNNLVPPHPATNNTAEAFENAKKSLALVRPGNVTDEELKQPTLVCFFGYYSVFGYYWRFNSIQLALVDMKTEQVVFKARQNNNAFVPEDGTLNHIFYEISAKFFPDSPNPFKK